LRYYIAVGKKKKLPKEADASCIASRVRKRGKVTKDQISGPLHLELDKPVSI
jgi:hypothetical protein